MLEFISRDKIMSYFASSDLFYSKQHGFRNKRSCKTQLQLAKSIDNGNDIVLRL